MMPVRSIRFYFIATAILSVGFTSAQILKKPDPQIKLDLSKGILVINPCVSGSLLLNDYFLTEINAHDTTYIYNIKPGKYSVKFRVIDSAYTGDAIIKRGKALAINPCQEIPTIRATELKWDTAATRMTGKTHYSPKKGSFYSIFRVSLIGINNSHESVGFFQSWSAITGYQVSRTLFTGFGITYSNYPFMLVPYQYGIMNGERLHFLPVFADLRTHLHPSSRHVLPFFSFDIGYNILLKKSEGHTLYSTSDKYVINKGGIYFSIGFGLRIFISNTIQIVPSLEYSFEKSNYEYTVQNPYGNYTYNTFNKLNFIKLCLGIGFQ